MILLGRLGASLVLGFYLFLFLPLSFVFAGEDQPQPVDWFWVGIPVLGTVALLLVLELVGYVVPPIRPGTSPDRAARDARRRFGLGLGTRLVLVAGIGLIGPALPFLTTARPLLVYLVATCCTAVLLLVHVWPTGRTVQKVERSLNRAGADVDLGEILRARPAPAVAPPGWTGHSRPAPPAG